MKGRITVTTSKGHILQTWDFNNAWAYQKAMNYVYAYHSDRRIEITFKSEM